MKVALSLEVTDDQRRELARRITAKSTSRLATRDEVREFVVGVLGSLGTAEGQEHLPETVSARLAFTDAEAQLADKLRVEGKSESYIRGYIAVGRKAR
jgi:hypothetical protein